jgi:hypothetical protein
MDLLLAVALIAVAGTAVLLARRVRAMSAEVAILSERVAELSTRMEAAEHDVAGAIAQTEVAETVLLDKGLADEEDLEAARRRFSAEGARDAGRDGELH